MTIQKSYVLIFFQIMHFRNRIGKYWAWKR